MVFGFGTRKCLFYFSRGKKKDTYLKSFVTSHISCEKLKILLQNYTNVIARAILIIKSSKLHHKNHHKFIIYKKIEQNNENIFYHNKP